jgi:Rad3-related DNA helicase
VDLEVRRAVQAGQSLILDGQRGSGKTCSMVNLVAWARAEGYTVIYIPNARRLTQESSYQKDEPSGLWDTPEVGLHQLNPVDPSRLKPPGFNP